MIVITIQEAANSKTESTDVERVSIPLETFERLRDHFSKPENWFQGCGFNKPRGYEEHRVRIDRDDLLEIFGKETHMQKKAVKAALMEKTGAARLTVERALSPGGYLHNMLVEANGNYSIKRK